MGIPKEPRQAMINMMYLVLTAMLALNISSEVLNAFMKVRDGLTLTNQQLEFGNAKTIEQIQERAKTDTTAQAIADAAMRVKASADAAYDALTASYMKIVEASGASDEKNKLTGLLEPHNLRDRDTPHNVMILQGEGAKLKEALEKARQSFASVYEEPVRPARLESMTLKVDDPKPEGTVKKSWASDNFSEVPTVAALAVIAKLQNDVRTTEAATLEYLKSRIGIENIEFNQLQGRTFPKKSYLNSGETYEADIFVSASSSSVKPVVYIGSLDLGKIGVDSGGGYKKEVKNLTEPPLMPGYQTLPPADAQGIVKYTVPAGGVGPKKYAGVIEVLNAKTGKKVFYPFESEYLVAQSVAVVSPEKMNMFYIGVDNPVKVAVPGYPDNAVSASITSGSITPAGGPGQYLVKVTQTGTVKVNVSVKTESGAKTVGSPEFRVSRIPDPKVLLGNRQGPVISSGEIKSMIGLIAIADNFPFDVRFTIRSFTVTYKKARDPNLIEKQNTGTLFSDDIKALLSRCGPGDRVWFDDIKVAAPDGTTRSADLSFKIIGG